LPRHQNLVLSTKPIEGASVVTWVLKRKAITQNDECLNVQFLQPDYRPLIADPRWAVFLEFMSSSPEQLDAIEF